MGIIYGGHTTRAQDEPRAEPQAAWYFVTAVARWFTSTPREPQAERSSTPQAERFTSASRDPRARELSAWPDVSATAATHRPKHSGEVSTGVPKSAPAVPLQSHATVESTNVISYRSALLRETRSVVPVTRLPTPITRPAEEPTAKPYKCDLCGRRYPVSNPKLFVAKCSSCKREMFRKGIATYRCQSCGNQFTGVGRFDVRSECYGCGALASAISIRPFDLPLQRKTTNTHSCELCNGSGHCPLMADT